MLAVDHASKWFGRGTAHEVRALNDLSLTLTEGEFVTVIGSNGAGKSTLLNVISGVLKPDAGTIRLDGHDWTGAPEHERSRQIGRVEQDPRAVTSGRLTIEENLALALTKGRRRGLHFGVDRQRRRHFRELLASLGLGLEQRLGVRMSTLSGGQRQAVSVLMATLAQPRILLLDEHSAALDPRAAEQVMQLTDQMVRSQRLSTLMVTHNMEQALRFGDRLIMLHGGRILFDVAGDTKRRLTVPDLLRRFSEASGETFAEDEALLVEPPHRPNLSEIGASPQTPIR